MKLAEHLSQGHILYLNHNEELLSVSENNHYRWLAFDNVVQSVMLKCKPWQLTLPHQIAMMLPLLFIQPQQVIEFGLGGGNLARFLRHYLPTLNLDTIEYSSAVIGCFEKYFNPQKQGFNLHNNAALDWLHHNKKKQADWLICDIYQKNQSIEDSLNLTKNILKNINEKAVLSLNLPSPSHQEIHYFLEHLRQLSSDKTVVYFHLPKYLNIIIHIYPTSFLLTKESAISKNMNFSHPFLPHYIVNRWMGFWHHGIKY